ncbi:MAG: Maf family protein [Deltaproteobacteria bacterium]|jgi:septum formation protein|nr:Maf family protein [Deltaproteobacteria bacterium]
MTSLRRGQITPLVLASASPRRRDLLAATGYEFTIDSAEIDESTAHNETPTAQVGRLAMAKAEAVAARHPQSLILAADTLVAIKETIYGKPRDLKAAKEILLALSGQTHEVRTCYCLKNQAQNISLARTFLSEVTFRPLNELEIDLYLAKGESLDKAGAYAIQGYGLSLIQTVRGSLTNVMGLPLLEVAQDLAYFLTKD